AVLDGGHGPVPADATKRASQDRSVHGCKKMLQTDREAAKAAVDRIIKNTYRTLMTRGLKGCFVFCTDAETNEYFRQAAIGVRDGNTARSLPRVADSGEPRTWEPELGRPLGQSHEEES